MSSKQTNIASKALVAALNQIASDGSDQFKPSVGVRRRIGFNGLNNLSHYAVWKKWRWPFAIQQQVVKQVSDLIDSHNELYFLKVPQGGHIDEWAAERRAFWASALALTNAEVEVEGTLHTLNEGDLLTFDLSKPHAVPISNNEQLYLVALTLGEPSISTENTGQTE